MNGPDRGDAPNRWGIPGHRVHRVHWLPGSDRLRGECHCGAERVAEDPIALWDWLLAHPEGHDADRPAVREVPGSALTAV